MLTPRKMISAASVMVCACLLGSAASPARGQCGYGWMPSGIDIALDDTVWALTAYNNKLIAGGWFYSAGGEAAFGIAAWDGTQWRPFSTGQPGDPALPGVNNGVDYGVYALAAYHNPVTGQDQLIVGGDFTMAGGQDTYGIAAWDGASWSPLGDGISGGSATVYALAVYNSELIVGGDFTYAGGMPAGGIAKWNGSAWSTLGTGTTEGTNGAVYALAVRDTDLIVAGSFTMAGGATTYSIARWNDDRWLPVGGGVGNGLSSDYVNALTVYNGSLIAGGRFTTASGVAANRIAAWDGTAWASLGTGTANGVNNTVTALCVYNGELIAGGYFTAAGGAPASSVAKWDGNTWSPLGTGMSGPQPYVYALTPYGNDLVAGGDFLGAGGQISYFWARWGAGAAVFAAADFDHDCHVDNNDLTSFSNCLTGPGVLFYPADHPLCTVGTDTIGYSAADFDKDGDVDQADFGIFQRCFSGPNRQAVTNCAD